MLDHGPQKIHAKPMTFFRVELNADDIAFLHNNPKSFTIICYTDNMFIRVVAVTIRMNKVIPLVGRQATHPGRLVGIVFDFVPSHMGDFQ